MRHGRIVGTGQCAARRSVQWSIVLLVLLVLLASRPVSAQTHAEWAADLRPFGATLSLATPLLEGVLIGAAVGGGIDFLDRTLAPDPAEATYHAFEQFAHFSVFMRQKPARTIDLDLGLRVGVGGVRECPSSDCRPGAFAGLYASAFWGTSRLKIGPRVLWALARESGTSDPVLYTELLSLRVVF